MTELSEKLVILDRDGVINLDSDNYIKSAEEWIPIESSLQAIARLNNAGYKVAIASNQSGIARGYFSEIDLVMIHKKMEIALAKVGAHIDALEYCADHPDKASNMRKPNPGMLNKLIEMFNIKAKTVWFVGDSASDIECAFNAGCKPALVLTGKEKNVLGKNIQSIQKTQEKQNKELMTFDSLSHFVDYLLN